MKAAFILACLLCSLAAHSQQSAWKQTAWMYDLLEKGQTKEAKIGAQTLLMNGGVYAETYEVLGRCFFSESDYDSAIVYFQKSIALDSDRSAVSGWGYANLGAAYAETGKATLAVAALNKAIALHKTENSVRFAMRRLKYLQQFDTCNFSGEFPNLVSGKPHWVTIEGERIVYHFEDSVRHKGEEIRRYIAAHEVAYNKINRVFDARLPGKLIFYVWNDGDKAARLLGKPLGFTLVERCTCHLDWYQTTGHEMTHALSHWGWGKPTINSSRLINEGLAVAFDLTSRNKIEYAKRADKGSSYKSVLDLWRNGDTASSSVLYPVGGALLSYLYKNTTSEQFKGIVKDQSIEHAVAVLGEDEFNKKIDEFDKLIGFR